MTKILATISFDDDHVAFGGCEPRSCSEESRVSVHVRFACA